MTKFVTLFSLVLALGFFGVSAAFADGPAPSEDTAIQVPAEPTFDLNGNQDQLFTPAELPTNPDLTDEGDALKVDQIRSCTSSEQAQCGSGCFCIYIFPGPRCFC